MMDQALRVAARKLYEAHSKNVPHALRWEQLSPEIQNKWGVEHQESVARSVTVTPPTEDPVLDEEWKQVQQFRLDSEGAAVTEDGWSQLSAEGRNQWRNRYRELRSSRPEGPSPLELEWKGTRELYELADAEDIKPWAWLNLSERRQWRERYRATGLQHQESVGRATEAHDPVNHPSHYTSGPSCPDCGRTIECIDITRHLPFNPGNAIKYLWRRYFGGKTGEDSVEPVRKARWYLDDEVKRLDTIVETEQLIAESKIQPPVQTSIDNGVSWQPGKEAEARTSPENAGPERQNDETAAAFFGETVEELRKQRADRKLARDIETLRGDR